ncbi:prepilin-type N-terminal cleavage/methylation domain-containing protein [Fundidesulfovibrio putealis]|uniref:prepilin-type N-terminal cleavage/methylation domain-containing protein n=1 Tax=Fundidesulfovibrio putealis TaxID=270496 RepID=UPI0009FFB883|nr:prepilin-type N-terminal cleavage/methylation domain-containing protein [Fundidesulfovibrio putealis]
MNPRETTSDHMPGPVRHLAAPPTASNTGACACLPVRSHVERDALPGSVSLRPAAQGPTCPVRSMSRAHSQRGVTLLELTLVLVLVGILAAVAISRRSTVDTDAFADGEALKGALRNARTRAMADIVSWTFTVAGQTGTLDRNGVAKSTITFETAGVAAGATTFDYRGQPTGTLSYAVAGYSGSPVTVTTGTGFVP